MGEIVCWMLQDRRLAIAVVSRDVKLANAVIEEAERRGVKAIHVIDPAQIPLSVKAAVVKLGEGIGAGHAAPVPIEDFNSAVAAVDRAMEISLGRVFVEKAVVGIDPGKKVGAAFIADNILLRTESYTDFTELAEAVNTFFENHSRSRHMVLMGSGAPEYRERLVSMLLEKNPDLRPEDIITVSEENTSKHAGGVDELAASYLLRKLRGRG
jgi:hypothetical protein